MRTPTALLFGLLTLAWLAGSTARGATGPNHSLDDIREQVEAFVLASGDPNASDVKVEVGSLDARLRLPQCQAPLTTFLPPGRALRANATVGVSCEGQRPWKVYVPVRVRTFVAVAVLANPVPRGEVVEPSDLRLEVRDVAGLRSGYYTRIEEAAGMVARRTLNRDAALSANMLTRPRLVKRGQRVTLVAGNAAVQVRTEGLALRDGVRGQVIGVRNVRSNRVIEGIVVSPGVVEVPL